MKINLAFILAVAALAMALAGYCSRAHAANLVSQTTLSNGKTVCVYSDGTSIVTSFNHCPSFK